MTRKATRIALMVALILAMLPSTGCFWVTSRGPYLGAFSIPIPVSPYFQKREEDKAWVHERYERVPILGPITSGGPPQALDAPSDDEVMRAFEKTHAVQGGIPFLWERQRNNVRITKELIADYVDPVRFYPMVGPAQQHHAHYKCTVYYSEKTYVGWPVPYMKEDQDGVEVIYVDHNHLHMVGDVETGPMSNY